MCFRYFITWQKWPLRSSGNTFLSWLAWLSTFLSFLLLHWSLPPHMLYRLTSQCFVCVTLKCWHIPVGMLGSVFSTFNTLSIRDLISSYGLKFHLSLWSFLYCSPNFQGIFIQLSTYHLFSTHPPSPLHCPQLSAFCFY